ncbi:MAG: hypothetical protein ABI759_03200, partial [Candidatus Solibacter sp.]
EAQILKQSLGTILAFPTDTRRRWPNALVLSQHELLQENDFQAGGVAFHFGLKRGQAKSDVDVDGTAGQRNN